ncbi:type II/IV secretion system ATPase subunit [Candidatus Woesearchaeota archaeon]|nr:type II/IV secretion system ATPase subunit [Candidatus Woesearchaeota archaeon]
MAKKRGGKKVLSSAKHAEEKDAPVKEASESELHKKSNIIDSYKFKSLNIPISVVVYINPGDFVPTYDLKISTISRNTEIILERIRKELVHRVNLGMVDITAEKKTAYVEKKFGEAIKDLIGKYFPDIDDRTAEFLSSYLIQKSLGLGKIEILMDDENLEEVAINSAEEPVWVYHRKHGWLKTTVHVESEDKTRHYASMIGRKVGRQITILNPLMDANMETGDRVNATLMPISNEGNTITLRKFAEKPWTITSFIKSGAISPSAAAMIWEAVQYEMSTLISGGTASGKTSMLNVVANFFPPNQRIISIEDTREIRLPKFLHWIPMATRLPNPEGKGEVSMLDLLVNSLRQRPDRIIVGEIRKKREAEVLFEAIHTGHSVYATVHANNVKETITRLTSPPIDIPKSMLPAVPLIITQYRNRRTGLRRTFQIAEILPDSSPNIMMEYSTKTDVLKSINKSKVVVKELELYTGMSPQEFRKDLLDKEKVVQWLVKKDIETVDGVGRAVAEYYTNPEKFMKIVRQNKNLF